MRPYPARAGPAGARSAAAAAARRASTRPARTRPPAAAARGAPRAPGTAGARTRWLHTRPLLAPAVRFMRFVRSLYINILLSVVNDLCLICFEINCHTGRKLDTYSIIKFVVLVVRHTAKFIVRLVVNLTLDIFFLIHYFLEFLKIRYDTNSICLSFSSIYPI